MSQNEEQHSSRVPALTGVLPVLPTIFDSRGRIDEDGQKAVLEYVIASGADGVVFPGLASEWDQLSGEERSHLVERIGSWIDGRIGFIVGASAHSPEEAITYAVAGAKAGAGAAMVLTPPALGRDVSAQIKFYRELGEGIAGLPIMLQNAPDGIGVGLSVEELVEIAREVSSVRYIKEETMPCGPRISALLSMGAEYLDGVYGGAGGRYIIDEMRRGAIGTLPACEVSEIHVAMAEAFREGDMKRARDLFECSLPLLTSQAIFRWRLTKHVLCRRGLINSPFVRASGPVPDEIDLAEIDAWLDRLSEITGIPELNESDLG